MRRSNEVPIPRRSDGDDARDVNPRPPPSRPTIRGCAFPSHESLGPDDEERQPDPDSDDQVTDDERDRGDWDDDEEPEEH